MGTYREDMEYLRNTLREAPWPYSLMNALVEEYGRIKAPDGVEIAPEHYTPSAVMALVADALSERERTVMEMRFRDHMTMEEVGKAFNVTREHIRQIEARALRKLRSPERLRRYASVPYKDYQREMIRRMEAERRLDAFLEHAQYRVVLDPEGEDAARESEKLDNMTGMTISDLYLSVRSFNCLRRAGVNTVGDILKLESEADMYSIRNLGRKSAEEIIGKIHSLGLKMKWEVK